jgi:hypothetical protein
MQIGKGCSESVVLIIDAPEAAKGNCAANQVRAQRDTQLPFLVPMPDPMKKQRYMLASWTRYGGR